MHTDLDTRSKSCRSTHQMTSGVARGVGTRRLAVVDESHGLVKKGVSSIQHLSTIGDYKRPSPYSRVNRFRYTEETRCEGNGWLPLQTDLDTLFTSNTELSGELGRRQRSCSPETGFSGRDSSTKATVGSRRCCLVCLIHHTCITA